MELSSDVDSRETQTRLNGLKPLIALTSNPARETHQLADCWHSSSGEASRGTRHVGLTLLLALAILAGCSSESSNAKSQHAREYRIASSSMAPTLAGPSFLATCRTCASEFHVAAETANPELPTRCFSCGGECALRTEVLPGEVVTVTRTSDTNAIRRFDCVVFRDSEPPGREQVKRVWGLPGEHVAFRNGDLWIDQTIYPKSLRELRQVAIPIARLAGPGNPILVAPNSDFEWRLQRPARVYVSEVPQSRWLEPSQIVDDYQVNQGVSRRLHPVDDFLVSLELSAALSAPMNLHLKYQGSVFVIHIVPSTSETNAVEASAQEVAALTLRAQRAIAVALCDGRLLIETDVDHHQLAISELASARPALLDLPLVRLTSSSQALEIVDLQVWRDLYLMRTDLDADEFDFGVVPDDRYFVLGDNLPVSIDSRFEMGCIHRQQIIGIVEAD